MYKPRMSTESRINQISKMYYEDGLFISNIAKELGMDFETVQNVLVHNLYGKLSKSEVSKRTFNNLTEEQKKSFINAAIEKRRTDEDYKKKLSETKLGKKNPAAKLNEEKVREIRKVYDDMLNEGYGKYEAQRFLANKFNVKRPTVSDVVLRRTWKHID